MSPSPAPENDPSSPPASTATEAEVPARSPGAEGAAGEERAGQEAASGSPSSRPPTRRLRRWKGAKQRERKPGPGKEGADEEGADDEGPPADGETWETVQQPSFLRRAWRWWMQADEDEEVHWEDLFHQPPSLWLKLRAEIFNFRYTFGYLAAAFLISAPIQMAAEQNFTFKYLAVAVALGVISAVPFLVLYPVTDLDWDRMRLPEFKNLELLWTRRATIYALIFLVAGWWIRYWYYDSWGAWLCDKHVAAIAVTLNFFAWLRVKFQMLIFPDFYRIKPGDDLVLVPKGELKPKRGAGDEAGEKEAGEEEAAAADGEPAGDEPAQGAPAAEEGREPPAGGDDEAQQPGQA